MEPQSREPFPGAPPSEVPSHEGPSLVSVAGRYVMGDAFASGGMGTVHLGRLVGAGGFSRVVAIKRLFPAFAKDAQFRELLLEEARLVSRIRHPNVVPVLDVVEADHDLYIVMEYIHGPSLAQLLARAKASEALPVEIAIGILEAVLLGLHAAHEARDQDGTPLGIVHRDVSPQNILVGADGVARLIDFGIAKAATRIQITDPGVVKGKIGYMSPEQYFSPSVSRQADIYASSVVLWEALANRRLFEGRSQADDDSRDGSSIRRVFETRVSAPTAYCHAVDEGIDGVVLRGLELEPSDRFPTAEAMAIALRGVHAGASAVDIARWLERFAPDELELAEERVRLLEQTSHPAVPGDLGSRTAVTLEKGVASVSLDAVPRGSKATAKWMGALGATLGAAVIAIAIAGRTNAPEPALAARSVASAQAPETAPVMPDVIERALPSSASVASSVSATSAPSVVPSHHGTPHPGKSACNPPYTIDAAGHKHYRPSCF